MIWQATIPIWVALIFIALPLALLTAAFVTIIQQGRYERATRERDEARAQRDKLNTKNAELFAQNADMRETLQEAIAERESLRLQLEEALKPKVKARIRNVSVKP